MTQPDKAPNVSDEQLQALLRGSTFREAGLFDVWARKELATELLALREQTAWSRYVLDIFQRAEAERTKAQRKFPQPNYVLLKVAEEAGEVVKAAVHYAEGRGKWGDVEAEAVQSIAMTMRLLIEGDEINSVRPPAPPQEGE